ncbi:hypothetical protein [Nonomuraea sp. 10N515B]|uniref:hypothetical protein n=1 Tax=Nonomuraea sp. 10N515B TaxID=3457422 RepID=UPI003FCE1AB1
MAKVQIVLTHAGTGSLIVDGHDIAGEVGGIELKSMPGYEPELQLQLPGVELAAEAKVGVGPSTAAALRALGWTPPSSNDTGKEG